MRPNLRSFRPRYSLRLVMAGFAILAALIMHYRDPMRRRLESLLTFKKNPANRLVIEGPQTTGIAVALDPPSPDDIVRALTRAGVKPSPGLQMIIEPISDYVDPPEHSWTNGYARRHHSNYKCVLTSDAGSKTFYIDHTHLSIP